MKGLDAPPLNLKSAPPYSLRREELTFNVAGTDEF
jgi:hypothetical protein